MPILTAGSNITLTLGDYDSVSVEPRGGLVQVDAVSGLGLPVGRITELSFNETFGPYIAGQIKLTAIGRDCYYEAVDAVRPVAYNPAAVAQLGSRLRTVLLGHSMIALNGHTDATFVYDATKGTSYYQGGTFVQATDYGWFTWADALMGAPHYLVSNSGISGQNIDEIYARLITDCLNYSPDLVYLMAARNSFAQGKKFEYVRDVMIKILNACANAGTMLCVIDCPPSQSLANSAGAVWESAKYNEWIRRQQMYYKNLIVISQHGLMVDPSFSAGGIAKTSMVLSGDLTHHNNLGAFTVGKEVARVMGPLLSKWAYKPSSPTECYDFNTAAEIRSSNPLMYYSTGGTANTGVTGQVANGYECGRNAGVPTVAASIVPDALGFGNAQRLVITFTAAGESIYFGQNTGIPSRWIPGQINEMQCDLQFDAANPSIINRCNIYSGGTFNGVTQAAWGNAQVVSSSVQAIADNIQPIPLAGQRLTLRTPRLRHPSSGTSTLWQHFVKIYSSAAGTVTVDVSCYGTRLIAP